MRAISSQRPQRSVGRRLAGAAAILGLYAIVCLAPTACGVAPSAYGLLLAPGFVLFAILMLGCTPGARLLEGLRARRFARRAPRAPRTLAMRRPGAGPGHDVDRVAGPRLRAWPSQGIRDPRTARVATHGRSDHE
jgi:hypothetical protein